jgi:flavodoxin
MPGTSPAENREIAPSSRKRCARVLGIGANDSRRRCLERTAGWRAVCSPKGVSSPSQPKVLVVYFSRTGTTRHLADSIARAAHGHLEELREHRSRRGPIGWLRCGYEGTYRRSVETLPLAHDLGAYDLVFVGSPTWNRSLSSPVRGFLERNGAQLKSVALFATCAERGADDVIAQMSRLVPRPPLATLTMLERDVKRGPAVWVGETVEAAIAALGHERAAGGRRSAG